MKKILILGVSGMAGHVVFTYLDKLKKYKILGTTNSNSFGDRDVKININDKEKFEKILNDFQPDFVINCVGVLIKSTNKSPENAIYANSYFPHYLARLGHEFGFKLLHISTDCVFSGKEGKYIESSLKNAIDLYGLSKSLGEIIDKRNITIRTSIIGPEIKKNGEGLFDWFMNQEIEINGYKSNFWSGVTTLELARFIDWVLDKNIVGLIHLTNNVSISKYDLLKLISNIFNKKVRIYSDKDYICDKSFINTNKDITFKVFSYNEMIKNMKSFMEEYRQFYSKYKF